MSHLAKWSRALGHDTVFSCQIKGGLRGNQGILFLTVDGCYVTRWVGPFYFERWWGCFLCYNITCKSSVWAHGVNTDFCSKHRLKANCAGVIQVRWATKQEVIQSLHLSCDCNRKLFLLKHERLLSRCLSFLKLCVNIYYLHSGDTEKRDRQHFWASGKRKPISVVMELTWIPLLAHWPRYIIDL